MKKMTFMPNYSKHDVILVMYPFTDLSGAKIRPAIVVNAPHTSTDLFVVPLTSRVSSLLAGEFLLKDWHGAGLNVPSVVKRGLVTVQSKLVMKIVGRLLTEDTISLEKSLRQWLGL
jgi:mRNA interferase MazF